MLARRRNALPQRVWLLPVKKDGKSEQLTLITPEKDIPLGSRVS